MIHVLLYYLNIITMTDHIGAQKTAQQQLFNRSPDPTFRDHENYDVHSITKKIQEQTKNIEDEIKKVAEIL